MKVKEESEKIGLKINIQKTKIIASGPITSWQIDGETVETVSDFTYLLLRRKVMTNLDSILKSRDITLQINVCLVKAMVFPVVMYGCESWTIKKALCGRIDAFELWCWRRPLRVPWTVRRSNQSILKEISPEYSLERLMLKLQHFGHLMRRVNPLEKTLMLGKTEGRRRRQQRTRWRHWLNGHEFEQARGDGEGQGRLACCSLWGRKELDTSEGLNNTTFQEIFSLSSSTYT